MTRNLARGLAKAGHEVRVIGISPPAENAPAFESDENVQVWRLKFPTTRFRWIFARREMFRIVQRWATCQMIDLVEIPDYEGLAARWPVLGIPVVARLNGSSSYFAAEAGRKPGRVTFSLERSSLRRADFLCSSSHYTASRTRSLFRLKESPIQVLHNPVTTSVSASDVRRSKNQVVFTGTLTPKKGVLSLMAAWPMILRERPEATLHIFGKDGRTAEGKSMREHLRASLPSAIRDSVQFYGHVDADRLQEALRSARVAVFPSYAEAFALSPMEAMAEGCPTIYSSRASGPELIEDGRNGLLVDPDRPEGIALAIVKVLQDDCLAETLGAAGKERVERNFSLSVLLSQNIDFYTECLRSFATLRALPCVPPNELTKMHKESIDA